MAVAEVSHRGKLRDYPIRRPLAGTARASGHRAERHRAHLVAPYLPDGVARAGQRRRVRFADPNLLSRRVVSQEAAYRSATAEPQASRRSVAHIRFWGIHRSPYERQRAFRHGTEVYGPEACPLHGALGAIHRRLQSPREFRQIPQGIAPRQAPDDRPARWPLHGARSGCGRRTAGVRPFKHGAARRLHSALPGLREERAEVGKRSALSNVS